MGIKKRLDELLGKELPPINIHCAPQPCAPASAPVQAPQVSISPTPANEEELAIVTMAAIAAYESDMVAPINTFNAPSPETAPARVHETIRQTHKRQNKRWTATARYENHKRL